MLITGAEGVPLDRLTKPGDRVVARDGTEYVRVNDPDDRVEFVRLSDGALLHHSWIEVPAVRVRH